MSAGAEAASSLTVVEKLLFFGELLTTHAPRLLPLGVYAVLDDAVAVAPDTFNRVIVPLLL
jgi:hypothetical protein